MAEHVLHVWRGSAPCRATLLALEILKQDSDLDVEVRDVDLDGAHHLEPSFLALNPLHTVPTLERDGTGLRESRAIMRYLCELAVVQSLYPEDPWARAQVDALLDWDVGVFYPAIAGFVYPQVFRDEVPGPQAVKDLRKALAVVDRHLEDGRPRLTGERLTLADLSVACGISMLELVLDDPLSVLDESVAQYYACMRIMPTWTAVSGGLVAWKMRMRMI